MTTTCVVVQPGCTTTHVVVIILRSPLVTLLHVVHNTVYMIPHNYMVLTSHTE